MADTRWRRLTAQETELARLVFSDGIDYGRVKIYRGMPLLPNLNVAVAPNGHIYFPRRNCPDDFTCTGTHYAVWLIHELTHVWQYQHGYRTWLGGLMLAVKGGYRQRCCYAYPPPVCIRSIADLNMEQQADLIAHYYAARFLKWPQYQADLPHFEAALSGFLANPHDITLLPKYRNGLSWFGWLKDVLAELKNRWRKG
ncbi:type IV secretion protein Rhs [Neisseria dentiae]|uniref:type IV secretion protein Rhs n=1 Tax=Neisseria dentiae TaxID=194197 RepID=UPI00211CFC79|nr:type IV secretion protein Rhs [Neisseria dentiae]